MTIISDVAWLNLFVFISKGLIETKYLSAQIVSFLIFLINPYNRAMIVKNASVYNPFTKVYKHAHLLIKNGIIIQDNLLEESCKNENIIIDLHGMYLYPAFVDSHCHLIGTGKSRSLFNIENVLCKSKLIDILTSNKNSFSLLRGWDENRIGFIPDRKFLDQTNPTNAVMLIRRCGHVGTANSCCIDELGLTEFDGIDGTEIEMGLLLERGLMGACRKINFNPTTEELFLKLGANHFLRNGITTIHSEDWNINTIQNFLPFLNKQSFIRLFESICISSKDDLLSWLPIRKTVKRTPFFDTSFIKLYLDGSLGGETAYLKQPYRGKKTRGVIYYSWKELAKLIEIAEIEKISIKIHIIGDSALEIALKAFSKAMSYGNPLRHKLIHAQLASNEQLLKILDLNLYVSIQPSFLTSDELMAPLKLGNKRYERIGYPFRKMHDLGINLSFSSDSPIESCNPFLAFSSSDKWLDRKNAFYYYTASAAKSLFQENNLGSLTNGKYADAFVCSEDIFTLNSSLVSSIIPEAIMFHGKWLPNLKEKT